MKRVRLICLLLLGVIVQCELSAQGDSLRSLSLEQAKKVALNNNLTLKNAAYDVRLAKLKVFETTATGLPHAVGKGAYSYDLSVPDLFKQFISQSFYSDTNFLKLPKDEQQRKINDAINSTRQSTSFDITVSQLVFSGSYIVGLQTSKIYKSLSNYSYDVTEDQILENVINSYISVLVARENQNLLTSSYNNTNSILSDLEKMYKNGLIDETTVDQMKINKITIKNSLQQVTRQEDLARKLLKIQLGVELDDSLQLTDSLQGILPSFENDSILSQHYMPENDPDYNLVLTRQKLEKQNYNLKKTQFMPSISAYYTHHENLNTNSVDFMPKNQVGINLTVPLISSGERISQLNQARIQYEEAQNTTELTKRNLILGFDNAKSSYLDALNKITLNRQNLDLSKKVYDHTLKKHREGMASSSDVAQAQNQLLSAESTYYTAIMQLVSAKIQLDKAFNILQ